MGSRERYRFVSLASAQAIHAVLCRGGEGWGAKDPRNISAFRNKRNMHIKTGGRTVTHHKAQVPKIQNNDNQPFAEDDTFVPKNFGVKSNLIFLYI